MHLVADYVHPYKCGTGLPSQCRVRIYLPDEVEDAPVVLCSELATNLGLSVTEAVKRIAGEVINTTRCRARYGSSTTRPRPPTEAQRLSTLCCSTLMRFGRSWWVERGGATRSALQAGSLWTVTLSKRLWAARSSPKHPPPPWPVAIREALHAPCDTVPS